MHKKRFFAGISTVVLVAPLLYVGIQNYRLQNNEAYQIGLLYRKLAPKTADYMLEATNDVNCKIDPPTRLLTFAFVPIPENFSPANKKRIDTFFDYFLFLPAEDQDKQHKIVDDFLRGAAPHKSHWDILKPL